MPHAASLFRALPSSGKSVALLLSASVHAAVALAAVRGAPHSAPAASLPKAPFVELADLELSLDEVPAPPIMMPEAAPVATPARHHHDYPVPPDHDARAHDPALRHALPLANAPSALPAAAPAVVEASAPTATPRFVMTVGATTQAPVGSGVVHGTRETPSSGALALVAEPAPEASVDTPAKLVVGAVPTYTPEAQTAGIEADLPLEIVVDAAGAVIAARALAHVGYGLDQAALRSVRSYRFAPARRAGKTLPVRMRWVMQFRLR